MLEFQNVAADAKKRQMWPVYLSPVGGSWTNVVNGFREWTWIGSEPQNTRQGNFISIVQLQQTYNLTFASMPPLDMMMQIQKRLPNGNASDWVIMKLTYPLPNSIQVKNNGVIVPPITITGQEGDLDTTLCGSNKFFYKNYTIHFVVTGDPNCKVQISLINTIQLTAHFDIAFSDFFTNNGQSLFVDRICALLKITDYSRVKVVSIFNGSIGIVTYVDEAASSDTTAPSLSQTHADLAAMSKNGVLASSFANTPLASINSITPIMVTLPDPSPNPIPPNPSPTVVEHSNVALIIGVTLSSMAIVAAALGVGLYCLRKRAAVV